MFVNVVVEAEAEIVVAWAAVVVEGSVLVNDVNFC